MCNRTKYQEHATSSCSCYTWSAPRTKVRREERRTRRLANLQSRTSGRSGPTCLETSLAASRASAEAVAACHQGHWETLQGQNEDQDGCNGLGTVALVEVHPFSCSATTNEKRLVTTFPSARMYKWICWVG